LLAGVLRVDSTIEHGVTVIAARKTADRRRFLPDASNVS
jgi:hypothetical protein